MSELRILQDLIVIFATAVVVVGLLRRVGVPAIAGFILSGILVGPGALALVPDTHDVEMLAEIGVVLLLFGIGTELSLGKVRRLWQQVLVGGALQVGATILATFAISRLFSLDPGASIFLGFLVAVSSTAIVLRGLESRGEIDAPHGRLTLGILIFQDLCVVPMMLAIPLLAGEGEWAIGLAIDLCRKLLVLLLLLVAARILVPRLLAMAARTRQRELFVLVVFLVSLGIAWGASRTGISLALGAFLAGLVVADSEYRHQALSEVIPFREVLASLFFVSVGMLLEPVLLTGQPARIGVLLASIVLGKFVLIALVGLTMRLPARVTILAGAALAQVGEFSFVMMRAADGTGLMDGEVAGPLTAAAILSMLVTPLAIAAGPHIATGAGRIPGLGGLLPGRIPEAADEDREPRDHVIVAGYGFTGQELALSLREAGLPHVVVDLGADNVMLAARLGTRARFGDVTRPDVLESLDVARARLLVVAVNDPNATLSAVRGARALAPDLPIIARARYIVDVPDLLAAGATEVVTAEIESAVEVTAAVLSRTGLDDGTIEEHIARIRKRRPIQSSTGTRR